MSASPEELRKGMRSNLGPQNDKNTGFCIGRPWEEWDSDEINLLRDRFGMTENGLIVYKRVSRTDQGLLVSSHECMYGCGHPEWRMGEETIEPHSKYKSKYDPGLHAATFFTRTPVVDSFFSSALGTRHHHWLNAEPSPRLLLLMEPNAFIKINGYQFIKASRYRVLDILEPDTPLFRSIAKFLVATPNLFRNGKTIGSFARNWTDVLGILDQRENEETRLEPK